MTKNYRKIFVHASLILACVFLQHCTSHESVEPDQNTQVNANDEVLQKIKSLGFAENQIKEAANYYLADGDLYFSKKISSAATTPLKKTGRRVFEKYATLTIHLDESLAGVLDQHWRAGIDQAIAEWNADENVHFHFAFTKSTTANINIVKDIELPADLAIASEFPRDGRTGSSIRVNVSSTKVLEDPKQAFAHALEHCVGFLHSTSLKNKDVKIASLGLTGARGPRYNLELYAVQGDILWRIDGMTGAYYPVKGGWAGTEVLGQMNGTGMLYMVQFGTLYTVNPATGNRTALTDGWEGSQYITNLPASDIFPTGRLYIIQDSWLWPVDQNTGLWDANLGKFDAPRGVVGFNDYDDNFRLAVLRLQKGSSTASTVVSIINPVNGALENRGIIPASGLSNWNGKFCLTYTPPVSNLLEVFNGYLCTVNAGGQDTGPHGANFKYPYVEQAIGYGRTIYIISNGTLYRILLAAEETGEYSITRLGGYEEWTDTSCIVVVK